jgi:hypothetical protein
MPIYAQGTFDGLYRATPRQVLLEALPEVDAVVGHEFAAPHSLEDGPGKINEQIAEIIVDDYGHLPIFGAATIKKAVEKLDSNLEVKLLVDITSDGLNTKGGTYEELKQVWASLGRETVRSVHVGQAFHIGRVAQQAEKVGFTPLIPEGLPTDFDPDSMQRWCRNRWLWSVREAFGVPALSIFRKLQKTTS